MVKTIKIPIELCQWAITDRKIPMLKVYIFCLFTYSGKTKLSKEDYEIMAHSLDYKSVKQIKKHFKELLDRNWIGYNKKSEYYFIRGIDKIRELNTFYRTSSVVLKPSEIKHLREFCFSAVITNLITQQQKKKNRKESQTETKNGATLLKQVSKQSDNNFFPVSNSVLASILKITPSYAYLLKKRSMELNYIDVKKQFTPYKGELAYSDKMLHRRYLPNLRSINNNWVLQKPDLVKTSLLFRRRKKIEPYQGDNI